MDNLTDQLTPEREAELVAGIDRMLARLASWATTAIAVRYLDEHGAYDDWCEATRDAYLREIAAAGAAAEPTKPCACRERGQYGDGWVRYQARDGEFVELRCRDHVAKDGAL